MEIDDDSGSVRFRLLSKETNLKKVTKKNLSLCNGILKTSSQKNADQCLEMYDSFIKELEMFEFTNIEKPQMTVNACALQLENFEDLQSELESQILETRKDVLSLSSQLTSEQQKRTNKEQYDKMASSIAKFPTRDQTKRELALLQQDLDILARDATNIATQIALRSKQFQLLLFSVHQLQLELSGGFDHP